MQPRKPSDAGDGPPMGQSLNAHSVRFLTPHALFAMVMCAWSVANTVWLMQATTGGGAQQHAAQSAGAAQLSCNPANRVVAACAHRGNAAELMEGDKPLLAQLRALWKLGGIKCFDMDAVPLADGHIIVGHPERLAALTNATQQPLQAADIGRHTLAELRQRGIDTHAAPLLADFMAAFAELIKMDAAAASLSAAIDARSALRRRRWGGVPMLSVELKVLGGGGIGKVAGSQAAAAVQRRVIGEAQKLRLSGDLLLWYGTEDGTLAAAAKGQDSNVLRGLIIRDKDMLESTGNGSVGGGSSGSSSSSRGQAGGADAANDSMQPLATPQLPHDDRLLAYDVLAPSIKLEEADLARMVELRPVFAWTVDSEEHLNKARRLGLDVVISNVPVKQKSMSGEGGARAACEGVVADGGGWGWQSSRSAIAAAVIDRRRAFTK